MSSFFEPYIRHAVTGARNENGKWFLDLENGAEFPVPAGSKTEERVAAGVLPTAVTVPLFDPINSVEDAAQLLAQAVLAAKDESGKVTVNLKPTDLGIGEMEPKEEQDNPKTD